MDNTSTPSVLQSNTELATFYILNKLNICISSRVLSSTYHQISCINQVLNSGCNCRINDFTILHYHIIYITVVERREKVTSKGDYQFSLYSSLFQPSSLPPPESDSRITTNARRVTLPPVQIAPLLAAGLRPPLPDCLCGRSLSVCRNLICLQIVLLLCSKRRF
uniref:Uncharacterized protein LOC113787602 n=1 Tax=Cicer arietinum TaxID=3827 RepID=A0A3Q7YGH9_CICAR|nr:uncharacterized protein LOC113787602 [Cicer arietinum]